VRPAGPAGPLPAGVGARARGLTPRRGLWAVGALEVLLSGLFFALGVRPDKSIFDLTGSWQVLDRYYLQHDLFSSLYHLHVQPPLFNLLVGGYIALPKGSVEVAMVLVNGLLGLVLVGSTYLLALELGLSVRLAVMLGAVVALSPSVVLYQAWEFYTFPTAALLAFTACCGARFFATRRLLAGIGLFAGASAVVLLNSTFQWPWLVALALVALVAMGRGARRVVLLAALPLVVVFGWYLKDALVFGTYSTSSMLGMNLAKTTLLTAPPGTVQALVTEGRLSPIALQTPFQSARAYEPAFARPTTNSDKLLREVNKRDRAGPNLDNAAEIAVSNAYLRADLAFIGARPGSYLASIGKGIALWFVPSEQYSFLEPNAQQIPGYVSTIDRFVLLQPTPWSGSGYTPVAPDAAQLSYGAILIDGLALFGLPVLVWSRRRPLPWRAALALIWVTVAYTFVLTSLVEYGENNRFRFDLGPLPLVGAAAVACAVFTWGRRRREGDSLSGA
jgi:hypothetical protein